MAHKKAAGKLRQQTRTSGKRLGVKVSHGEPVTAGSILVRQRGAQFHPGDGTKKGRDFSLFATKGGRVDFGRTAGRKVISVKGK